jgi:hypothetical protein
MFDRKEYGNLQGAKYRKENKERLKKARAVEYAKNKDTYKKWRDAHSKRRAELNKNWFDTNPGKRAAYCTKYNADKLQRTPTWADHDKINEFYKQAAIATVERGEIIQVDHIIPLKGKLVSGLHTHDNLQLLTKKQNRKKSNNFEVI